MLLTGGCHCGHVRYEVQAEPFDSTVCHCADCRRVVAAPVVAWFSVPRTAFRFVSGEPKRYASSEPVLRTFCPDCGTPLTYQHHDYPDDIDVATCSLDAPERVPPMHHTWTSHALPWVVVADGLPRYPQDATDG
ncbi:GFA family protein [Paraburkholderia kururiensis]|uniref:GFA family protein n=1 Tax=Paraburkholderia kururiensis TaxID=984307 RepID=A0ABZ0WHI5_9BURK|nr:GFA family protein [Paraburkholderia kururiensis]WQD76813.1 GFA family protein [Paraburkholderia kururiensis]